MRTAAVIACLVASSSCTTAPPVDVVPLAAVDIARVRDADVASWRHSKEIAGDLNANGVQERITLSTDVTIGSNGRPIWEDGHRWAVMVAEGDRQTLVYGAFVPNGHVDIAVLDPQARGGRGLLVVERTPNHLRTFVIAYDGPGRARTLSSADHSIVRWAPSLIER